MKTAALIVLLSGCGTFETAEDLDQARRQRASKCYQRPVSGTAAIQALAALGRGLQGMGNSATSTCTTNAIGVTTCNTVFPSQPLPPPPITYEVVCYDADGDEVH